MYVDHSDRQGVLRRERHPMILDSSHISTGPRSLGKLIFEEEPLLDRTSLHGLS